MNQHITVCCGAIGPMMANLLAVINSGGRQKIRFMGAKKDQTLHNAGERLLQLRARTQRIT